MAEVRLVQVACAGLEDLCSGRAEEGEIPDLSRGLGRPCHLLPLKETLAGVGRRLGMWPFPSILFL